MTNTTSEHPEQRLLNGAILACAVAFHVFVLWRQIDPDADPRALLESAYERACGWLAERRAISETLRQIEELPELEDTPS